MIFGESRTGAMPPGRSIEGSTEDNPYPVSASRLADEPRPMRPDDDVSSLGLLRPMLHLEQPEGAPPRELVEPSITTKSAGTDTQFSESVV